LHFFFTTSTPFDSEPEKEINKEIKFLRIEQKHDWIYALTVHHFLFSFLDLKLYSEKRTAENITKMGVSLLKFVL